ncbi:hypothetical protein D1P53_001928 [Cryptococcus gattii VGV]|nr:hypothetical protein D1P53_001928 [Cryptococcus gattii VGV]
MEYGPELNNFLFEAAMDRLLVIASDRYGARCLLRCLESSKATLYQKKLVATSIVLNSIPLATNSNGALLLTWMLGSSNLRGRYDLISKRFLPHLSHLCNHRIPSCSILRIIGQSSEPGASKSILKRMFLSKKYDCVLKGLLLDSPTGLQFIGKILAFSTISPGDGLEIEEAIRTTLSTMTVNYTPEHHALKEDPFPTSILHERTPSATGKTLVVANQ